MRMLFLSAVLFFVAGAAQAATLNVVAGQLMGASGVDVGGTFYDVQFLDGTCIDLFNGCDDTSDFTFQTGASATLAGQALLDQVLVNSVAFGQFDDIPSLTNGCELDGGVCLSLVPWALTLIGPPPESPLGVVAIFARNYSPSASQLYGPDIAELSGSAAEQNVGNSLPFTPNSTVNGFQTTWAVFSLTPVPEPTTALLLGLGLTGLAGKGRRRNRS